MTDSQAEPKCSNFTKPSTIVIVIKHKSQKPAPKLSLAERPKHTVKMQMRFLSFLFTVFLLTPSFSAFQSDELLVDDEEFGLEGAPPQPHQRSSDPAHIKSPPTPTTTRRKFSDSDSDSKIQFYLEHAFGDSDFVPAGTFSARLKTWSHGGQVLFSPYIFFIVIVFQFGCFFDIYDASSYSSEIWN